MNNLERIISVVFCVAVVSGDQRLQSLIQQVVSTQDLASLTPGWRLRGTVAVRYDHRRE